LVSGKYGQTFTDDGSVSVFSFSNTRSGK